MELDGQSGRIPKRNRTVEMLDVEERSSVSGDTVSLLCLSAIIAPDTQRRYYKGHTSTRPS